MSSYYRVEFNFVIHIIFVEGCLLRHLVKIYIRILFHIIELQCFTFENKFESPTRHNNQNKAKDISGE